MCTTVYRRWLAVLLWDLFTFAHVLQQAGHVYKVLVMSNEKWSEMCDLPLMYFSIQCVLFYVHWWTTNTVLLVCVFTYTKISLICVSRHVMKCNDDDVCLVLVIATTGIVACWVMLLLITRRWPLSTWTWWHASSRYSPPALLCLPGEEHDIQIRGRLSPGVKVVDHRWGIHVFPSSN